MSIQSAIYTGTIRHRRFTPRKRFFQHRSTYFYLDLDEIQELIKYPFLFDYERPALFSFERKHFLGDSKLPLADSVRSLVRERLGFYPTGPIRLLAQVSYFGFCFNPVVFYYCFDEENPEILKAVVAEITNTPWNERHAYVLVADPSGKQSSIRSEFEKVFHVSPFLSMDYKYKWSFNSPEKTLVVHMENLPSVSSEENKIDRKIKPDFDSTLTLYRTDWSTKSVAWALLRQPFMTYKTLFLIYLHAAILWIRRFRFYPHPKTQPKEISR